jgi:putative DNA primase/helicase
MNLTQLNTENTMNSTELNLTDTKGYQVKNTTTTVENDMKNLNTTDTKGYQINNLNLNSATIENDMNNSNITITKENDMNNLNTTITKENNMNKLNSVTMENNVKNSSQLNNITMENDMNNSNHAINIAQSNNNCQDIFEQFKKKVFTDFTTGSGIDPALFESAVEFHRECEWTDGMDASYPIHETLGWKKSRFTHNISKNELLGAFLKNEDGSIWQVIVNIPSKHREYSYFAPKGIGDKPYLPPVPKSIREKINKLWGTDIPMGGSFWDAIKEMPEVPRFLTEGGKKALSGLSTGLCAIALYGCSCGGKKEINPALEQFTGDGSAMILAMDRDTKKTAVKAVLKANRRFHYLLKDSETYLLEMRWKPEHGKGLDDLITKNPKELKKSLKEVKTRLDKLKLELHFQEKRKIPTPDILAAEIAEEYRDILAFNNASLRWMRYQADSPGVWAVETDQFIASAVMNIVEGKGYTGYGGDGYITNVTRMLRHHLIQRTWVERSPKELLPFRNGVLEIQTGKLMPHAPGYRLTWQLPREYDRAATNWDNINEFLNHLSGGNQQIKDLLMCYCNAVIKGRSDLQKFLHLIGLGGTGKGTFTRLLVSLIGSQNVHTSTLDDWCNNNFEAANAYQKRLVLFPDEDKATGKLGKFLSLTGEDLLRAENKGQKAFSYRYDGMVAVCSNLPVFAGDSASRVKRRVITVPCNNTVGIAKRKNLEELFEPELAAFTNHVLNFDDDYVRKVLSGIQEIPECTLEFWVNRMRVDSLADWLNEKVIYDPTAMTPVGSNKNEGADGGLIKTLFGSYSRHCAETGSQAKASKTFSPDLIELCNSVLGWGVKHKATNTGKFIVGLRLRQTGLDDEIPTHELLLSSSLTHDGKSLEGSDGSEVLLDKAFEGSDENSYTPMEIRNNNSSLPSSMSPTEDKNIDPIYRGDAVLDLPSLSPNPTQDNTSDPSPVPQGNPSPDDVVEFFVNDRAKELNHPIQGPVKEVNETGYVISVLQKNPNGTKTRQFLTIPAHLIIRILKRATKV